MNKKHLITFFIVYSMFVTLANFVHPVTPSLLKSLNMPDYLFGILYSSMSLMWFVFSPFWGRVIDIIGINNVTVISLLGYSVGQFMFLIFKTEALLIFSRLFAGTFASGQAVSTLAYVIEYSEEKDVSKNLTIYNTIISFTTSFGFLIGGTVGNYKVEYAFILQIVLCIITAFLFLFFVKDYNKPKNIKNIKFIDVIKSSNPLKSFIDVKNYINKKWFLSLFIVFLYFFYITCYDNAFNYYSKDILNLYPYDIGLIKAIIGIVGFICNVTITIYIVKKLNLNITLPLILSFLPLLIMIVIFNKNIIIFSFFNILFYTMNVILLPIIQTISVNKNENISNSLVSSIFNSSKSLGMITGGFFSGFFYYLFPSMPFWACIAVIFVSIIISIKIIKYNNKDVSED